MPAGIRGHFSFVDHFQRCSVWPQRIELHLNFVQGFMCSEALCLQVFMNVPSLALH
jgi:hypothetical protein